MPNAVTRPVPDDRLPADLPSLKEWQQGTDGIEHVVRRTGAAPGPTVALVGITHGNEVCGAVALDRLLHAGLSPVRGRVDIIFANVAAYRRFDYADPLRARLVDSDLNRVWSDPLLADPGGDQERRRAAQLRRIIDQADWLLDLHSMHGAGEPIAICGRSRRAMAAATRMGLAPWIVADDGHPGGVRLIDYGGFTDPDGSRTAILLECGTHLDAAAITNALHASLTFLHALEMLAPGWMPEGVERRATCDPTQIEVTETVIARSRAGVRYARPLGALEIIAEGGTLIGHDGDRPLITPYDDCHVLMPAIDPYPGQTICRLGRRISPRV